MGAKLKKMLALQAALQGRCSRMDVEMPYAANFGTEGRKSVKVEDVRYAPQHYV